MYTIVIYTYMNTQCVCVCTREWCLYIYIYIYSTTRVKVLNVVQCILHKVHWIISAINKIEAVKRYLRFRRVFIVRSITSWKLSPSILRLLILQRIFCQLSSNSVRFFWFKFLILSFHLMAVSLLLVRKMPPEFKILIQIKIFI